MSTASVPRVRLSPWNIAGGRWVQVGYVLADLFFVCFSAIAVFHFRFVPDWLPSLWRGEIPRLSETHFVDEYVAFLFLYCALIILFCKSYDLYRTVRTRSALDESLAVAKAVMLATLLLTTFIYLSNVKSISRLVVGTTGLSSMVMLTAWRLWRRQLVQRRAAEGIGVRNVLIIGAGKVGQALARYFDQNRHLGLAVKGFLDGNHSADPRVLGRIEDLSRIIRSEFIDEVFISIPSEREIVRKIAVEARRNHLDVKLLPEMYDGFGWGVEMESLGDFPVMSLHKEPIPALGLFIKRTMDIVLCASALVVLSPLLGLIALLVKFDSPGSALYRAPRVGRKGRRFACYKFRTMVAGADALKEELRTLNEREGPTFKIANDPRLTRVGRFLRKFSLDELPQLWNVLKGDMSLVGPRPHPVDDCEQYTLEHLRRLDVTPGITGLWQVTARHDPSFETNMRLDLQYIENWDLWLDVKILLRTFPEILKGMGQ